jgi:hypothetical protein
MEAAAAATVFAGREAVINLVRPLPEGREADPALRLRMADRPA